MKKLRTIWAPFATVIHYLMIHTNRQQWLGFAILLAVLASIAVLLPSDLAPVRWFAAYNAALALVSMMVAFVMATRLSLLERLFGGLDKLYVLHRWAGMLAVVAIFLHWWLVPQPIQYTDSSFAGFGSDTGEWATWLLLGLVLLSFSGFLPYRFWKMSHKLMGGVFIISVIHLIFAVKPFALLSPVGLVLLLVSAIGIWAWAYYAFGFNRSKRMLGKVKAITHKGNVIEFSIRPIGQAATWQAGQFAFITFLRNQNLPKEAHPFTISSAANSNVAKNKKLAPFPRFSVAALGDYTRDLAEHIKENDIVELEMPYGDFTYNPREKQQVWIGAGIGVTPFLAWLHDNINTDDTRVNFYYCVKNRQEAIYHEEILSLLSHYPNVTYHCVLSEQGRLTPETILDDLDAAAGEITSANVYFCGGSQMRDNLQNALIAQGLAPNAFHYERFDFRG